jgi:hypothetical protein
MLAGVSSDITEVRAQEIFNYALYDQPDAVRTLIGFGRPLYELPPMLHDFSLQMVWAPMVRILADGLGLPIEEIRTSVDRRPLTRTIDVPGMGVFDAGTQGAFRFEVQGWVHGHPLLIVEHVTRIDDECAPEWVSPQPGQGGMHRVLVQGQPNLTVTVHAHEPGVRNAAGGGNATAANRIVNAIPAVALHGPGAVHPIDLAAASLGAQVRSARFLRESMPRAVGVPR